MEDLIEVIEIWRPVESGGEAVSMREGRSQQMKLVAFLVGGYPVKLEDDYVLERRHISKEESVRALASTQTPPTNKNT